MRPASALGAAAITWLLLATPAQAATFTVDTTKDGTDAAIDGTCAAASGKCTLRAAIDEANAQAGNDEIVLPKGTFELTLAEGSPSNAEGDLDVTEAVEIAGRGPGKTIIEQTVKDRVLRNDAPFAGFSEPGLQLSKVTLTGGIIGGAGESGGAGLQQNQFALLDKVVIRDNIARSDAADNVPAAGLYSAGITAIARTVIRDNAAVGRGDTSVLGGGIVVQDGGLTIQDGSAVVGNTARLRKPEGNGFASAGGIVVRNPGGEPEDAVSVFDSTIAGNSAKGGTSASAGGVSAGVGTFLDMRGSTVSGNRSRLGGGIYATSSELNVSDSTISGNSDTGAGGAAIFQQGGPDTVELTHVTIAGNKPSAGHFAIESGEQAQASSLHLFASIVSNPRRECGGEDGAIYSGGHNIVADTSCAFNPGLGADLEANPQLRDLAGNGGPTRTHALKGSSPAVDYLPGCSAGVDQRGFSRPVGAGCDIGSFERGASAP
jgi:hypothetical protein